jgi:hypothetical protein
MPEISRRKVIQSVAGASVAALSSSSLSSCRNPTMATPTSTPDPSLYLIFTGAWALYFPDDKSLIATTTHFNEHQYDFGVSRPDGLPRVPLTQGKTYDVTIKGAYSPSSIDTLLASINPGDALILKGSACKPAIPVGGRTIRLPLPSSISPAALVHPVDIDYDSSVMQAPLANWPTALVLVYSGNWDTVTLSSDPIDPTEPTVRLKAGDLPYAHFSFRTCLADECNVPLDCKINCTKINSDISHAGHVFKSMLDAVGLTKALKLPFNSHPCIPDSSGQSGKWDIQIDRGADHLDVHELELGMPATACTHFSSLRNCASGTFIVAP